MPNLYLVVLGRHKKTRLAGAGRVSVKRVFGVLVAITTATVTATAATTAATATAATVSATTAAVATATAAVSATTAAITTAAFATWGTLFTGTGNIYTQVASVKILVVEHLNSLLSFLVGAHFNKGKTAGTAGELIEHQLALDHGSGLREQCFK